MSWFYGGCYPFDAWENSYENWLFEEANYAKDEQEMTIDTFDLSS